MKITRIDNGDGKETEANIDEARDRIEGPLSGYYKAGTIDELIAIYKRGGEFTLRTTWARWRFEL